MSYNVTKMTKRRNETVNLVVFKLLPLIQFYKSYHFKETKTFRLFLYKELIAQTYAKNI